MDGILLPGGFGDRGIEGKIISLNVLMKTPSLSFLFLGMQMMAVEFARNILNFDDAHSSELTPSTNHPIINLMEDQKKY